MRKLLLLLAFLCPTLHAQSCVTLTLQGTYPDPMPLTNPVTVVTLPVQISNNCSQTVYWGKWAFSGAEAGDDTSYKSNGCLTVAPGDSCYGMLSAWADMDDSDICQPANASSKSFCVDTLALYFCFVKACPGDNYESPVPTLVFQWTLTNPKVEGTVLPATFTFTGPVGIPTADQTITVTNTATCGSECTGLVTVGQVTVPANVFIDQDNCSNQSVPEGQSCTVTVYAIPASTTQLQGVISVPNNLGHNVRNRIFTTIN